MRIGFVAAYAGAGIIATRLADELVKKGHSIHMIMHPRAARPRDKRVKLHNIKVHTYSSFEEMPFTIAIASKIAEVTKKENIDVWHIHYGLPFAVSAFLAKQIINIPILVTLHGSEVHLRGLDPNIRPVLKMCLEKMDYLTTISKFLIKEARKIVKKKRISLIPNFVDTNLFKKREYKVLKNKLKLKDSITIIHISNFRPIKDIPSLIKAVKFVSKKHKKIKVLMVGKGPEERMKKLKTHINRSGLKKVFIFVGKRDDVYKYINVADIFVLSSLNESFGLTILEAMACEKVTVATDVGGIPEIVTDKKNALLVKPKKPKELANAISKLIEDQNLRKKLGKNARKRALDFDKSKTINKYIEIYRKLKK